MNQSADELPLPLGCCIGGGKHFPGESVDFQEYLLIPHGEKCSDNILINRLIHKKIERDFNPHGRSYTGGWVCGVDNLNILKYLTKAAEEFSKDYDLFIGLGIDIAATHFFTGGNYFYRKGKLDRERQIKYINSLISNFNLEYVEDPLEENDRTGFGLIKGNLVCGDDVTCTNLEILKEIAGKINCVSIKPTQIGSLVKCKQLVDWARENGIDTVMSHRSGETNDPLIADLSVAWKTSFIKTGIVGEGNAAKLKRLKEIEASIK